MTFLRKLILQSSRRKFSTRATHRKLLNPIYFPISPLGKSSEHYPLVDCGKIWEEYATPQNIEKDLETQENLKTVLEHADEWKERFARRPEMRKEAVRSLIVEYAHQSAVFGGNTLRLPDATKIDDGLETQLLYESANIVCLDSEQLAALELPLPKMLLPGSDEDQVAELRNQILVTRFMVEKALTKSYSTSLSDESLGNLCSVMLRGTQAEDIYLHGWGADTKPRDSHSSAGSAESTASNILPFHTEAPACMKYFLNWRKACFGSAARNLHPILRAAQMLVYFSHIHPFPVANARVGRALMADSLVKYGFLPVVLCNVTGKDYLRMVLDAQSGNPEELYKAIAIAQLEMLITIGSRSKPWPS